MQRALTAMGFTQILNLLNCRGTDIHRQQFNADTRGKLFGHILHRNQLVAQDIRGFPLAIHLAPYKQHLIHLDQFGKLLQLFREHHHLDLALQILQLKHRHFRPRIAAVLGHHLANLHNHPANDNFPALRFRAKLRGIDG